MKASALVLAITAFLPIAASAQNTTAIVQGTISDYSTKMPLDAVHVRAVSRSGSANATSDAKGFFTLWNVPLGAITVSFERRGYVTMSGKMCMHPGMKRNLEIRLSRTPGSEAYEHYVRSRNASGLMQPANVTTLANC